MRKYNYEDHFDLLTIRHEYLKDTSHIDESYLKKFDKVVRITSSIMYKKLHPNFDKVGFDYNDILSISKIYLLGYLANYGFKYNQKSVEKFLNKFTKTNKRQPTKAELFNAERNEVINFLRQRLQNCALVCSRKARNITVGYDKTRHFAKTSTSKDTHEDLIFESYKEFGYRKVTAKEFKEAKQRARKIGSEILTDENGFEIFTIQKLNQGLETKDYLQIVESYDTIYTSNPESYLIKLEEKAKDSDNLEKFNHLTQSNKISTLKNFIQENKGNEALKEEIGSAKKLLKKHSFWYGH